MFTGKFNITKVFILSKSIIYYNSNQDPNRIYIENLTDFKIHKHPYKGQEQSDNFKEEGSPRYQGLLYKVIKTRI